MRTVHIAGLMLLVTGVVLQQEPFRVQVDVSLVTLDVSVTDSAGRPVTYLARDDFKVYEDGVLQDLRNFYPVDTPYTVLMLFDCSTSTQPDWPFLVEAMNRFMHTLRPQDRIAIARFGSGFRMLREWFAPTESALDVSIQTGDAVCGGTNFYGAVERGARELAKVDGRKGVIVLSDGGHDRIPFRPSSVTALGSARYVDAADDRDFQKLLRVVADSDVIFYFVAVDTDLNPDGSGTQLFNPAEIFNKQQLRSRLEQLAAASGGRVVFPKTPVDVAPLYERIARELGTSYGLGYVPANANKDGTYRRIEVRVDDASLKVHVSREGYQAR